MKLLLAVPTYGPVDPQSARAIRAAMMTASNHGVQWGGDESPDGAFFSDARNSVVATVLQEDCDGVLWSDSDMVPEPDAYLKLASAGQDLVSCIYYQRKGLHLPMFGQWCLGENCSICKVGRPGPKGMHSYREWPAGNLLYPVDCFGFGTAFTSKKLLLSMPTPHFEFWGRFGVGEDLDFCLKAQGAGFQPYIHTGVTVGHLGDRPVIGHEHYVKALAAHEAVTGKPL